MRDDKPNEAENEEAEEADEVGEDQELRESSEPPVLKKRKVDKLHEAPFHDITNPNATTGVPYFVAKGAKHVLFFFRINQLGLKERIKLQVCTFPFILLFYFSSSLLSSKKVCFL